MSSRFTSSSIERYNDFSRLNPAIVGWHVHVKVLRRFHTDDYISKGGLGLLLVDDKGNQIEALICSPLTSHYSTFIEEDEFYTIMNFRVVENSGFTKLTRSDFKIMFYDGTIVKEADMSSRFTSSSIEQICSLSSLNPLIHEWSTCVKILHVWHELDDVSNALNLILMDNQGTKIRAVIRESLVTRFSPLLIEGLWMILRKVSLISDVDLVRTTPHRFKIQFSPDTCVEYLNYLACDYDYFNFARFRDIRTGISNPYICVDLVGKVDNVNDIQLVQMVGSSKDISVVYFDLIDTEHTRLSIRLTGETAVRFHRQWKVNTDDVVICIIRFAKIVATSNRMWHCTNIGCSKIMVDAPLPGVVELKEWWADYCRSPRTGVKEARLA
ncbi:hypothetical protein ARALYDRAFT_359073 [Arabidopsis lyrata subsp. lyrata]|uniref:Replication protein A 70 kDa DNA-binding subunit B/D first OB fold domain-containing protein n=1 Tax=Arabidopsis lyrata subsp. lyrata TaxID=81972 RepID=D7MVH4_ARALL|nr:hypothetical protein ARALYDRAFT_359073 [Arabidopsis lyrata subsp. lyrata]